jgi:ABC-type methionine transport system permease subunit
VPSVYSRMRSLLIPLTRALSGSLIGNTAQTPTLCRDSSSSVVKMYLKVLPQLGLSRAARSIARSHAAN